MLGAMRHDHVWVDAKILIGILTLDDPRAFALYEAAIRFMGGRKAEMRSHLGVTLDLMRTIWLTALPDWERGRAIGRLLDQLARSRPNDWKAVLHLIDANLGELAAEGDILAGRGRDYLTGWIIGHFHDLDAIRSYEKIITEIRTARPLRRARKRNARHLKTT
jgi:CBS domain-containing protein